MKSAKVKKIHMLLNRFLLLNVRTCLLFWVWKRLYLASKRDLEENIGKYGWISCSSLVLDRKNSKARCLLKKIWPTISSSYVRIKNLLRQPCGINYSMLNSIIKGMSTGSAGNIGQVHSEKMIYIENFSGTLQF